jgi:hypothetical protein
MKRALPALAIAAVAMMMFPASGSTQAQQRATVDAIDAETTPKRDRSRPYSFTTSGKVTPPPRFCAAGGNPGQGGQNCIPVQCPPGQANKGGEYCFQPPRSSVCSGTVTVRFQKNSSTISSRNVQLREDCTYSSQVSFSTRNRNRRGTFNVRVRFQGNSYMQPRSSGTHSVRAG